MRRWVVGLILFELIGFGGMSRKNGREGRRGNNLYNYFPKPANSEEKALQACSREGKKKPQPLTLADFGISKEGREGRGEKQQGGQLNGQPGPNGAAGKGLPMAHLLKNADAEGVAEECPRVGELLGELQRCGNLPREVVMNLFRKWLQGGAHSLWAYKYRPL